MSTGNRAAPHVSYSRGVRVDGGDRQRPKVEIREQEERPSNAGPQRTGRRTRKKPSAAKRRDFKVVAALLGTFFLLMLTSAAVRYISVTVQRDKLQVKFDQLHEKFLEMQTQCSELENSNTTDGWMNIGFQDDRPEATNLNTTEKGSLTNITELNNTSNGTERGKGCPPGWVTAGCSCYYEVAIVTSLQKSKDECEKSGGNLIVVNSIEKQRILKGQTAKDVLQCGSVTP